MTRATIPGRAPLCLFGELIDNRRKWILILTRDGKGYTIIRNSFNEKFPTILTQEVEILIKCFIKLSIIK